MGTRVYVGNLPFSTTEEQLRALFEEGGRRVSGVKLITDRFTGRSRGFAFVEMETEDDAKAVISTLSGRDLGGRPLTVSEARERSPREGGGSGRDHGGGSFGEGGRDRY